MHCYRKITEDLLWIGGNNRRQALFEGVYRIPRGVSYNSYLLMDEKTVLFDTVDQSIGELFFENLEAALGERTLDYIVVHHMEPDHSATLSSLLLRYPDVKIICNAKTLTMMKQFFTCDFDSRAQIVKEGETVSAGRHELTFIFAPLVHWPEVMFTYDKTDKILFTADAFGTFGALDGAIFADEVDFERDYLDEARRYYSNIVGKYGMQVQNALKKAAGLDIAYMCPLHGFVWRENIAWYIDKYQKWSTYTPEEKGVVIAYASIYGHTANAADILACMLREKGIKTCVFDLSVTEASDVVSAVFRYSHVILASPTYNAGIFVKMDDFLRDLAAHNIQNRTAAVVESGTWAISAGKQMKEIVAGCKNMTILEPVITIKSSLKEEQQAQLEALAAQIAETMNA